MVLERNIFGARDEHFSAGDEHVENVHSNFSHTHTQLASYQQLPNRPNIDMIAFHRYSPPNAIAFSVGLNGLRRPT